MAIVPPNYSIIQNDIIKWADNYDGPLFHAMLTDSPYHLASIAKRFGKPDSAPAKTGVYKRSSAGFMGQDWDSVDEGGNGIAFKPETWAALAKHLYPGAFIMSYAGTRGYHRMACAMEDAGLIIHPAQGYLFGSGFPKATRIDTQIDKLKRREYVQAAIELGLEIPGNSLHDWTKAEHAPGDKWWDKFKAVLSQEQWLEIERKVVGQSLGAHQMGIPLPGQYNGQRQYLDITAPATPLAQTWQSHRYGLQALKPAFEFIAVAQVPYPDRPIDSIVSTGAGALNIDAGRIQTSEIDDYGRSPNRADGTRSRKRGFSWGEGLAEDTGVANGLGRWPSNFLLIHNPGCNGECEPDCPVRLLDEQSGTLTSGKVVTRKETVKGYQGDVYGAESRGPEPVEWYGDSGGASRFFYQADWSHEILEQIEGAAPVFYTSKPSTTEREAGLDCASTRIRNDHPCVKPISLNKYLASLLLPPDAYAPRRILNPFMGSGSEAIGAVLAGWESVTGIEQSAHYVEIAQARLAWWSQWPGWGQTDVEKILAAKEAEESQLRMF